MNQNSSHPLRVCFLLDRSSSMGNQWSLINDKLNKLSEKLTLGVANGSIKPHVAGLASFGSYYNPITWDSLRVPVCGGDTLLFDSCAALLNELTGKLSAADKVLIIVITDGVDNMSRSSAKSIASEVTTAEDILEWDFLFLGTNINAYKVGAEMGVKGSKTLGFANSKTGFEKMLDSLDSIICKWLEGQIGHTDSFFSVDDRTEQEKLGAIRF